MAAVSEARELEATLRAHIKGRSFLDIILYNNAGDMEKALERLQDLHRFLFQLALGFSVLQGLLLGIVLLCRSSAITASNQASPYVLFFLILGCILTMCAAVVSFICLEYCNGMKGEDPLFILRGCQVYKIFFMSSEALLYVDSMLFLTSINLFAREILPYDLAVGVNIICVIAALFLVSSHWYVIVRKQSYSYAGSVLKRKMFREAGASEKGAKAARTAPYVVMPESPRSPREPKKSPKQNKGDHEGLRS